MNKKGFTLVELLGVITIMAVILTIIIPVVGGVLNRSKNTIYNAQVNDILNSAYDYSLKKINLLPDDGETTYILLNELKKYGFIENSLKDPKTNEEFSNDLVISIQNVGTNYKNNDNMALLNGNYLYKIETNLTDDTNKPTIVFTGYSETPTLINLNIGDIYTELEYTAESSEGDDLTDEVITNITYNLSNTAEIDTMEVGIYHVDYCVVDDYGYSICERVNVAINDSVKPVLTIPDHVTISTSITSYDLMNGVECSDNSGKCDIEVTESIKYGVSGKYTVSYKAFDPSGNTTEEKRVITIE